jgi:outer membrane protein assembly factor BamB
MIINRLGLVFAILVLSGFSLKNPIKNPVDLTTKIVIDEPVTYNYQIKKPVQMLLGGNIPDNILLNDFLKLASYKLLDDNIACEPIVINDNVCSLYALDESSYLYKISCDKKPKILWKYNLLQKQKSSAGGMKYSNGKLYITNGSRYLFIVDASNGEYILEKEFPDIIVTPPLVKDQIVYLQDINNNLHAFDTSSGKIIWKNTNNIGAGLVNSYNRQIWSYEEQIISLSNNGMLKSLNMNDGSTKWSRELFNIEEGYDMFLIKDFTNKGLVISNHIYVSNSNGHLYKIDLKTGGTVYDIKIPNIQTITKAGNLIILINAANQVIAMNPDNGKFIWTVDLFEKDINTIAAIQDPQILNNNLYVITNKYPMVKINPANGKIISRSNIGGDSKYHAIIENKLYIFFDRKVKISINK